MSGAPHGHEHGRAPTGGGTPLDDRAALDGLIRQAIDPLQLMQRIADQALEMIDSADGVLVGLVVDRRSLRYVCGSGYLTSFVGEPLPLEGSLSGLAIRTGTTLTTSDTESDSRVERSSTRAFSVRSSVCVPLGRGEQPVGILNVCSGEVDAFDERDVDLLSGLADFISVVIGAASDFMAITTRIFSASRRESGEDAALTGRFVANVLDPDGARALKDRVQIERILHERDFALVFQPIFDLGEGGIFGVEALARFGGTGSPPPDVWFAQAHSVGLGIELEVALVVAAVAELKRLGGDVVLAVNAGPEALISGGIEGALRGVDPTRIIVELTEHAAVADYQRLSESLAGLRSSGVRLAIDDAGAGFASLMHILKLAPDFIKLDRELISGIDMDPVRRSLADSLMRFAEDTGATIVAEGVENETELAALNDLGIRHAQGFYLARPMGIEDMARRIRQQDGRVRRDALLTPGSAERTPGAAALQR
jgi:EAL domain-containing protein (putative c-di-GMP-specific phosphodiesterase class I)